MFALDALAAFARFDLGDATGQARLVEARWQAARALLLELIGEIGGHPDEAPPIPALSPMAEGALIRPLIRSGKWAQVDVDTIVRADGGDHA